jgi:hypothetical protein
MEAIFVLLQALFAHATEAKAAMEAALKAEGGDPEAEGIVAPEVAADPASALATKTPEMVMSEAAAAAATCGGSSAAERLAVMQDRLKPYVVRMPAIGNVHAGLQGIQQLIVRSTLPSVPQRLASMMEMGAIRIGNLDATQQALFRKYMLVALQGGGEREGSQEGGTPTPPPAAEPVKLFEVDQMVFRGGVDSSMSYQAPTGRYEPNIRSRPMGKGGYVEDAEVKKAYAQVREGAGGGLNGLGWAKLDGCMHECVQVYMVAVGLAWMWLNCSILYHVNGVLHCMVVLLLCVLLCILCVSGGHR